MIITGNFIGNFYTDQKSTLMKGQIIPEGNEHFIRLYRGELRQINKLNSYNPDELRNRNSLFFRGVENVQMHAGDGTIVSKDVVKSFQRVTLNDVNVKDTWEINGKTYGLIEGTFTGEFFDKLNNPLIEDPKVPPTIPPVDPDPIARDPHDPVIVENPPVPINPDPRDPRWYKNNSGCLSDVWRLLKWFLIILLIIWLLTKIRGCNLFNQGSSQYNCEECEKELIRLRDSINGFQSIDCNSFNMSGGIDVTNSKCYLGDRGGQVVLYFNTHEAPDKIEVYYENEIIASTFQIDGNVDGFVGSIYKDSIGSLAFDYNPNSDKYCIIKVTGGNIIKPLEWSNTKWEYEVTCPN